MHLKDILEVGLTLLASLGGGGAIVFGLSGFLGKVWADRALEKQRQENAQINIEFTHQLELFKGRVQVELDARTLLQKLRIEGEFEKIKELWVRIVALRDAFSNIPKAGFAFVSPNKEIQHKYYSEMSNKFVARFYEAYDFWTKETLSIPNDISDHVNELLKVAQEEVMQVVQYPDPFEEAALAMFNESDRVKFFENRASNIRVFTAMTKELERKMRNYIAGGWMQATDDTPPQR